MGSKPTKRQRKQKKEKNKQRQIRKLESLDRRGIARKKWRFVFNFKRFAIFKIALICLIPLIYFVYSPLLVVVIALYVSTFFLAIGVEHALNKSVIKSNHVKIQKYDAAVALVLILIGLFGSIFGMSQGRPGRFSQTIWIKFLDSLRNFGTLLTGNRLLFGDARRFGFGTVGRPEGFVPNSDAMQDMLADLPPMPSGGRPHFEMDLDNIPIEFMFSQILSTVNTVLVFLVCGLGILSLYYSYKRIKKFNLDINEVIEDGEITMFTDEEINRILSFGEDEAMG